MFLELYCVMHVELVGVQAINVPRQNPQKNAGRTLRRGGGNGEEFVGVMIISQVNWRIPVWRTTPAAIISRQWQTALRPSDKSFYATKGITEKSYRMVPSASWYKLYYDDQNGG